MKRQILVTTVIFVLFNFSAISQSTTMYAALKSGLSIRDKPAETGKVIGKIPYGTQLSIAKGATTDARIITEGFYGYWVKVTFGQLSGYVVNSYLLSVPPPNATIQNMKAYLLQLCPAFGAQVVAKNGVITDITSGGSVLKKQLYRNGASCHEYAAYEYNAESCFIPNLTTKEAFLLVRLIPEYSNAVTPTDPFPLANKRYKRNNIEYDVTVEKEQLGDEPFIKKIHIEFSDGSANVLEIFELGGEVVISYSGGV